MQRSTKEAWLDGAGDLAEDDVLDVPVPGQSVRVRALSGRYSADVQGQMKLVQEGREQVARLDIAAMEARQFLHGVIEPTFTLDEVIAIQDKYGPAFKKVIARIDELSGIDKAAIAETEQRFPVSGAEASGPLVGDEPANGNGGSDVPARAGA